tara:strand:+ start:3350 stop:3628 length:279 start_codon:yes stop_codon:yes gene_type:complete
MTVVKTRSGRVSKQPVRLEPTEIPEDDYSDDGASDEDFCETDGEDICETDDESESEDESDADEQGNLKGFVVDDDDVSEDESYVESDEEYSA